LLKSKGVESLEDTIKELVLLQHGFPEVYHLIKVAMTIPVTSATAERSFCFKAHKDVSESYHGTG
jgi:hypothetical protein